MRPHLEPIRVAAERLASVAVRPRRESETLFAHALGLADRTGLRLRDAPATDAELEAFEALVARRAAGEPLAYVLGYADFYNDRFLVPRGVFIPRPDTETLVDAVLEAWGKHKRPGSVLELGTGTGAIVISLLRELPFATAVGIDVSIEAVRCTRTNAERLGVGRRLRLLAGDLASALGGVRFDVVVSNPPYVGTSETLPPEVRDHEPHRALYAGETGFDVLTRLPEIFAPLVVPNGIVAVEIGATQGPAARTLFEGRSPWADVRVLQDLGKRDRVVLARA